jgi:hypothetical protein
MTSKAVTTPPKTDMSGCGTRGFNVLVYAIKLSQLPHTERSLRHNPKRSATAERKPALKESRKNHSMILNWVSFLQFIEMKGANRKVLLEIQFMGGSSSLSAV